MERSKTVNPLYLNIIWHQHQPLYLDPAKDQLAAPWVRTHGTKDYYDMAAMLAGYPAIHVTINLTSVLLFQIQTYYVDRLKSSVDGKKHRIRTKKFFTLWEGKTDPWIDILLKPASSLSDEEKSLLTSRSWSALSVSSVLLDRFPQYKAVVSKVHAGTAGLTERDFLDLKFWFSLAFFDPDFLRGAVVLPTGVTIDLSDLVEEKSDGTWLARRPVTEDDCNRLVAETYLILAAIVPIHRKLLFDSAKSEGQIEVITTPYYHPILPLLCNSDVARICQPGDPLPRVFRYPDDAEAQVAMAVRYYEKIFGRKPTGLWPGEGAVSDDIAGILARHGILWTATDEKILRRSSPPSFRITAPAGLAAANPRDGMLAMVFRETDLSDRIGFTYKERQTGEALDDFMNGILKYSPAPAGPDTLLTIILDGENAWEWYRYDNDGKNFLNGLYKRLTELQTKGRISTVTMTEYIRGNSRRKIPPHPIEDMPRLQKIWPGSWINANFDTWIGEPEENTAWDYLRLAREDLALSGIPGPALSGSAPRKGSKAWYAAKAWEEMLAAEGSDWFWWYGADQTSLTGDDSPFDNGFRMHLETVYTLARKAGGVMPKRTFTPITDPAKRKRGRVSGTMAKSRGEKVVVLFQCDARQVKVPSALFISGNLPQLGSWKPNTVRMYDDGTHGDRRAGDGIWTLEAEVPAGAEIQYKFTNSGVPGAWDPGEEFPGQHRTVTANPDSEGAQVVLVDTFGKI